MNLAKDSPRQPSEVLSQRVRQLKPSGIRRFFDLANERKGKVLSLSIGEPDFVTPWNIREAGIFSLEKGHTHYTANQGIESLRRAIAGYMRERFSICYNAETETVVTVGGSEAIDASMRALLDPGDEVVIPEPCFVAYRACAELAGAIPVSLPLCAEEAFRLTPERLESVLTPRTKMLILAYPNNPTGGVMEETDLRALLPVLARYPRVLVLSDELYAELTYAPATFCSISRLPGMRERSIVIGGFSKAFAMTGWRIGFAMAEAEIAQAINKIHQYGIMSAPTTAQHAALEALENGLPQVEMMRQEYDRRRRLLYKGLRDLSLPVFEPMGAFYMFPDIKATGLSSMEFCERFLCEQSVAIVPGDAFGDCGAGFVRISYASSLETLQEALRRLEVFLNTLS